MMQMKWLEQRSHSWTLSWINSGGGSNKAEQRGDAEGWRGAYVEVLWRLYEEADILEYEVETACE